MPWTENNYPQSWKNFDVNTRRKAIEISNAMLEDGYKEEDLIPIATAQAKKWAQDATDYEKSQLRHADLSAPEDGQDSNGPDLIDNDVHVQYNDDKKLWVVKTEGAMRAAGTFDTKAEAKKRAQEIAQNRGTKVIEHLKDE